MCFCRKFENSKWPPFFGSQKFFEIWAEYLANVPWGSKISMKSLYLAPLRRYEQFCVFAENSKIQNGRHFRKPKIFLILGRVSCKCTLGVENFDEIALSCTVKEIRAILCFRRKFENSKWLPFFESQKFFDIWAECLTNVPWGSKISTKWLYLAP